MQHPRLLIISNQCLSNTTSNGRTLRNFLVGWPKEKLAQFYIHHQWRDDEICEQYYHISDGAALRSFLKGRPACGYDPEPRQAQKTEDKQTIQEIPRNAFSMLLRNAVWNSMCWAGKEFYHWVDSYKPEVILLQAGDCAFLLRLARRLAHKYQIPLVIYNSEAYYFKKHDYFYATGVAHRCYPIFHRHFRREFCKTMQQVSYAIYSCDKLKKDYSAYFDTPSEVIYAATEMTAPEQEKSNDFLKISYLGNLGVGRHEGLVEIGNVLQAISPELKLDVYGNIPNEEVEKALLNSSGIHYCGFVPYEEVQRIMYESDILVHTESFSEFYREDLKYAFSTKIADSLGSGKCFLLYAPENMACTEYLIKNQAAYVVKQKNDLLDTLRLLNDSPVTRKRYIENAQNSVAQKHMAKKNASQFQDILIEGVKREL